MAQEALSFNKANPALNAGEERKARGFSEDDIFLAAVPDNEEMFRWLFDVAPVGLCEIDYTSGRFLRVNKYLCKFYGYSEEEFLSLSVPDILHPEAKSRFIERRKQVLSGNSISDTAEYKVKKKDGSEAWVIVNIRLIYEDGKPVRSIGAVQDITQRKKMEEAHRASEEKYRLLVDNANDAIFIAQDGKIKFANPKTLEVLGYTPEEMAEISVAGIVHPLDREMVMERHRRRLAGEDFPSTYNFRLKHKSGVEKWSQINAVRIVWEEKPATLNFVRDISEQKSLEEQLLKAQKMEAIGTLAGGIAHDFNNLMMGIQGRTSLMLMGIDSSHPHHDQLKGIDGYVKSATDLTKQLLGFARGGKYEVKPKNVNRIVEKSVEMFGRTRKEITIDANYEENLWVVEVDPGQIEQALLNIYVNAWQAMPSGGKLFLQTENLVLDQSHAAAVSLEPGDYVKISVSDTGIGMDKETMARVFEPFFTTKQMGRGTGLGLASAFGIVRNHGGMIQVHSEKELGSTFVIYLPASKKAVEKVMLSSESLLKGKETVLLVDDEQIFIDVTQEMLEFLGYRVLSANTGSEAIGIYQQRKDEVDIVILDIIMPDMGGGDVFERLQGMAPEIKVLLSSGYSIDGEATQLLKRGCSGFIQKPFDLTEFSRKLREILD